jgi:nucleoid-associated protein YgaU
MGFLDNIKNALGGKKEDKADVTVGPSQVLRDNGIDPSGLDFGFNSDGSVTVKGTAASERERQRILEIVGGIKGVKGVKDNLRVAPASAQPEVPVIPAAPEPEVSSAPDPEPATDDRGQKTYTVQPGDTLWKIAEAHYGEGSKYTRIFEANRPMLEDPDKIFPGQELVIPREKG